MTGVSLTFTGTPDEIAAILEAVNGTGTGTSEVARAAKSGKAPVAAKRYTASSLANKSFADLKEIAEGLEVDTTKKKSAGLRKAILDAQDADSDEEEEEDESDEDEDDDWDDEDSDEEDDEDEDEDEEDEDDEDDEEEEEAPAPKRRGRPAKATAKKATAARKAPARRKRA